MILFAQEFMGPKNLMAEPGAKKHISSEEQTDILFQKGISDEQAFLNLLADFIKQKESLSEKDIFIDSEEPLKKDFINFIISAIKPENLSRDNLPEFLGTENFTESFTRTSAYPDIAIEIRSLLENLEYQIQDSTEANKDTLANLGTFLKTMFQDNDHSGKTVFANQVPMDRSVSKPNHRLTDEINDLSLSTKLENPGSLESRTIMDSQATPEDIIGQSLMIAKHISSSERQESISNQIFVAENPNNRASETTHEFWDNKTDTNLKQDHHNLSREPYQKVFENNLVLKSMQSHTENDGDRTKTLQKDSGHFSDNISSRKETRTDQDLRQVLNFVDRENTGKPLDNSAHSNEAIIKFAETESTIQKEGQLPRNITVDHAERNLQAPKQSGLSTTTTISQTPSPFTIHESGSDQNIRINQTIPAMARDFQQVENTVISQVINRLFTGIRQGSGNMTIFLHPPELGKVKVRIITEKGGMNITLHPKSHQVVDILQKHLPALQHSLQDQEIALSDLRVSIEFDNHSESTADQQEFRHSDRNGTTTRLSEEDRDTVIPASKTDWADPDQGFSLRV